jgi:putative transposase
MQAVEDLAKTTKVTDACDALGVPRASFYRWRQDRAAPLRRERGRNSHPRALAEPERQAVLETLNSERFVDQAPAAVWATLLDEGRYLCSVRTMYRLLATHGEVRERRDQLRHPWYEKPELLATGPNQVWSWDITKLLGPVKWTYFYLYVILDIFSRYVVGWMAAHRESSALAKRLVEETCRKQGIVPGQLTMHADRGSSMRSKPLALLLADLGVTKTHSRPHVSNDNPYSESQFKTLKYRPEFPKRFGGIEDARSFCQDFFPWYNREHRHSGIGYLTPEAVHFGRAQEAMETRARALAAAYAAHPERFVRRAPRPPALPTAVWINPPLLGEPNAGMIGEIDVSPVIPSREATSTSQRGKPTLPDRPGSTQRIPRGVEVLDDEPFPDPLEAPDIDEVPGITPTKTTSGERERRYSKIALQVSQSH